MGRGIFVPVDYSGKYICTSLPQFPFTKFHFSGPPFKCSCNKVVKNSVVDDARDEDHFLVPSCRIEVAVEVRTDTTKRE